jgi:hypothetical protein
MMSSAACQEDERNTSSVLEHTFTLRNCLSAANTDLKIYDVGGERSQRQAWASFHDDANLIIFLGAYHCCLRVDYVKCVLM